MNRRMLAVGGLLALFCATGTHAEVNSKQRVAAFARLPDWSGLWEQTNIGVSGLPASPEEAAKVTEEWTAHPPYKAEWEEKYQAAVVEAAAQADRAVCLLGFPSLMIGSPLMFQAIMVPEETTLIFSQRETRHIYTDGSSHPAKDALWATPWGHSVGRWEGQTLVVDTVGTSSPLVRLVLTKGGGFTTTLAPFSDQARFIERIRLLDKNTLEDQIMIEDPIAFTAPWKLTRRYRRVPNMTQIVDEDCSGKERNPVVNGKFTIAPGAE